VNALDLVYLPVAALTAPFWARKARGGWSERFGNIEPLPAPVRPRVMLHGVSVGETNASRALVPLLSAKAETLVTASTDTGLKRAGELYKPVAHVRRYPLDASWSVRKFLDRAKPQAVALVELELWPNFIRACGARNIAVGVVNGRLSERSFKGYRKLRPYLRPIFASLRFAAVQDEDYRERFIAMGVPADRCVVTGSMKWDSVVIADSAPGMDELAASLGIDRNRPLVVAGSTGPGEEALLVAARDEWSARLGGPVQLLCAPRKPERFDEAAAAMPGCVRRSTTKNQAAAGPNPSGLFLLDTIGELRAAFALADVAVVGRSFMGDLFGSDPIEPIGLGRATVIGPHVEDFKAIVADFERAQGLARADRANVARVVGELLSSRDARERMADAGRDVIRARQGASRTHAEMILGLLDRR
jgi:3-deoxy-D-manno-octulosonic-acid transferase